MNEIMSPASNKMVSTHNVRPEKLTALWIWWLILCITGGILSFLVIGIPIIIIAAIIGYIMLYKWWSVIQDGPHRTTPGKAVGFCFIPVFNLYWFFVAFVGLAKDINLYCKERNINVKISEGFGIFYYVLLLLTILTCWIPFMIFMTGIPTFIMGAIFTKSLNEGVIAIIKSKG